MSRGIWFWTFVFGIGIAMAAEPPKRPEVVASVASPGKVLTVEVGLDEGRASYAIKRFGETVIAPSRLGFLLRGAEKLERNLVLGAQSTSSHDDTWEQPWGESRFVRNFYGPAAMCVMPRASMLA